MTYDGRRGWTGFDIFWSWGMDFGPCLRTASKSRPIDRSTHSMDNPVRNRCSQSIDRLIKGKRSGCSLLSADLHGFNLHKISTSVL